MKAEGQRLEGEGRVLACFAVKEEAGPFRKLVEGREDVRALIVGMGRRNAEAAICAALAGERPRLVLTCGFAGGLAPELAAGTVVFDCDAARGLDAKLRAAGAKPARFHCAQRVAANAAGKQELRNATGADAVEMESEVICAVCRARGIPCATVRVILDTAGEDLPLDFNALMTPDLRMDSGKLALALLKSPGKIGALRRLQQQAQAAAERLAAVLATLTEA